MAKDNDGKCRLCRREGIKLFLKGARCLSPKCPIERKGAVPPGQHGAKRRRRPSEFGSQLREKQKAKKIYSIKEKQFKNYFNRAKKVREATGEVLLQILESRLDNIVYRLGFAPSRAMARQLISHGHILVDGKKVDIASFEVKPGMTISLSSGGLKILPVMEWLARKEVIIPDWLEKKAAVGRIKRLPKREEIGGEINEQAIVEFYSR